MKVTTMTREGTKTDARVQDLPAVTPKILKNEPAAAKSGNEAPQFSAHGRRMRKWLIAGNIMAWILLILAARAIFS